MTKKKETKKPYILVESDFSPLNTHIYVVGKNGKKTKLPNVLSAKWEATPGSEPVKIVAEEDRSQDYETDSITVFELENGKFAVVIESGCSCYDSSSDAAIEVHATYEEAMKSFNDWKGN